MFTAIVMAVSLVVPASASALSVEEFLADVRVATARYRDVATAREDGFVQISGMEALHGYHFMNINSQLLYTASRLWSAEVDLAKPPMLLYVERDGLWQLVGVEYALPTRPAQNPFPGSEWHQHEASCHYRDYREVPAPSPGQCPPRHPESGGEFVLWHPGLAVAHVWAWSPNPSGPFAELNPSLATYGGTPPAAAAHSHDRSGTEVAFSEFNHRSAGVFLLLLTGVIIWESRRPRPFPWNALSAPLWIMFGVYLFVRSDPEAWPWGPKGVLEILTDPQVVQHKMLTLIPVAIGLIEGLRRAGRLRNAGWGYLFPALAVFGGVSLFFHFHAGGFHLDWVYVQHAAIGITSLGVGIALFLVRRATRVRAILARAWPVLIFIVSLTLLFYSEP